MKDHIFLFFIIFISLSSNLLYLFESRKNPFYDAPVVDAQIFLEQALEIAATKQIRKAEEPFWQPPLYPYFLAFFCRLFPDHYFAAIRLGQSLLNAASCVLIFFIAHRSTSQTVARTAATLASIYGVFVYFAGELLAVSAEIFINLLLLYCTIVAHQRQRRRDWIRVGILGGFAGLMRPNILLFLGLLMLWTVWREYRDQAAKWLGKACQKISYIGLPLALIILPVTVRNYLVADDLVFISSNGGINFYIGNNANYDSTVAIHPGIHWENLVVEPVRAGYEKASARSRYFFAKSLTYILHNPSDYMVLLLKKLWLFWSGPEIKRNQDIYYARAHSHLLRLLLWDHFGLSFPFGLIGPLSLLGLALTWSNKSKSISLLRLYTAAYIVSILLFFVTARYRAPVIPALLIFAACALATLGGQMRDRLYRPFALTCAAFLVLTLLFNWETASRPEIDAQLYHDLGEVHLRKTEYSKSIEYSKRALELNRHYASAHHNLAVAHLHEKNYGAAIHHTAAALALNPHLTEAKIVRARAYMAALKWREAEVQLRQALETDPDLGPGHYYLARLLAKQQRHTEAISHFLAALDRDVRDFWTHYELALAYKKTSQWNNALHYLHLADSINPRRPEAVNAIGAIYLLRQDYAKARHYLEKALARDPQNPQVSINLGLIALREKRFAEAIPLLQQALPKATNPTPVYRGLLEAYTATGAREKAQAIRHKLRQLPPAP